MGHSTTVGRRRGKDQISSLMLLRTRTDWIISRRLSYITSCACYVSSWCFFIVSDVNTSLPHKLRIRLGFFSPLNPTTVHL